MPDLAGIDKNARVPGASVRMKGGIDVCSLTALLTAVNEAEIQDQNRRNFAVTVLLASRVTTHTGLREPVQAPLQPMNLLLS